jgi:tetratricopeptide (TPR) repeat protein
MAKAQKNSALWIYNPWLDLIVGCGAWSAPLLALSYFTVSSSARMWAVAFYVLALFFNYPHYMATIYRAYHRAEDFQKYRVFTVHITALVVLTILLSHFWARLLPWIFTIYLTWSPWHYSGQNYGLFMMFARRAGANPDQRTRRALYSAFIASYLILFLGFHTGPSSDPLFLSLGILPVISRWEQIILGAAFVILSIYGLSRLAKNTGWKKLTPSLTLFSSQFLWFLLPSAISLIKGLAIPQSRYSTGVLAVMHSAQYLWITSYYARREAAAENQPATEGARSWRPFAYFGVLVLGGIALFVPGPWLASRAFHHDFTASFLIFTALINIHHFILDGAIWKLRDGRIASLLLNSKERISDAASQAGGQLAAAARWLVGDAPASRALRVSAATLLLAWGTVDQVRYYLALRGDDLRDLERAAALNSFDSTVQMSLAHRAFEDGHTAQAEAAWRRAMQANPADPAPRQALLQFLIGENRFDEAFKLTETSLQYTPKDANLLVDRGLLDLRFGKVAEASADWEQAIKIDPTQFNARLYLASELDREGKAQPAAEQYEAFLEAIVRRPAEQRPAPDQVIAVVMRMADCQSRASQTDTALKSYRLAEKLAGETLQPKLASVAYINEAVLVGKTGNVSQALPLYQNALRLDQANGDDKASSADWLAYAHFLNDAGFSPRLVYACLLKSQRPTQALQHNETSDSTAAMIQSLEKKLGPAAEPIRRDPELTLIEALDLRR